MRVGGSAGKGGPRDDGVIGLEPVPRNMAPTKSRSAATVHLGDRAAVPQNGAGSTGSRKRPKENRMTAMEYFAAWTSVSKRRRSAWSTRQDRWIGDDRRHRAGGEPLRS